MKKKSPRKTKKSPSPRHAPSDTQLADLAHEVISEITDSGRKNHPEGGWYHETEDYHLFKAIGHISTAQQLREGYRADDSEGDLEHLKHALCRITMALGKRLLRPIK